MAMTFSLAVYSVTIHKRGDKSDIQCIGDFGKPGIKLLDELELMLTAWKKDEQRGDKNIPIQKDGDNPQDHGNAFRLAVDKNGNYQFFKYPPYLKGIIESGEYGTIEEGINIETGEKSFDKTKKDVLLRPFYFMFYLPENSSIGFLIMERISQYGITTILSNAIKKYWKDSPYSNDYIISITPIALNKLIDKRMQILEYKTKKIELRKIENKQLKLSKISDNQLTDNDIVTNVVYRAIGKNKLSVGAFLETIKRKRNNENTFYQIDEDLRCDDVAVTVEIDGNDKVLSLQNIHSLGFSMDISNDVKIATNGYPTFESVDHEASVIVSYIKSQFENLSK